jgi:glycine/D-amino acid oxidase-like deaminating enzyme
MKTKTAEIVICGAGIAGISTAYHLAVRGVKDILLVDERPPMNLTSDKSSECYRNWWPGPDNAMVALTNHSIDLMEKYAAESGNSFHMNRRGYLYLTADEQKLEEFIENSAEPARLGAGSLRIHRGSSSDPEYTPSPQEGYQNLPSGADLFLDPSLIRKHFPYLPENVVGALHARRAGWLSAQQLGAYLLEKARVLGVRQEKARVENVVVSANQVRAVELSGGASISTSQFVNAAGPFVREVGKILGVEIPVFNEQHQKVAFRDPLGVVPRGAPLLIWSDPQVLSWTDEERRWLQGEADTRAFLDRQPAGVHVRPEGAEGSMFILLVWEYDTAVTDPIIPPDLDEMYPEVALRGTAAIFPELDQYFQRLPQPQLDGGYYTKTRENRPLIGSLPADGAYVIGALSGFGLMAGCGAGDLLAARITGEDLPSFASAFELDRYEDPAYQALLVDWSDKGQL